MPIDTIAALTKALLAFRDERDWKQFHNPKDLATALSIEASELQEIFLWKNGAEIDETIQAKRQHLEHEVADIAAYLLLLCNELDVDLEAAVLNKIEHNKAKYPADQVRGNSKKYDEYHDKD
ncbi:MAG: NTP pyrophosphatase (non-canonical NTP hydrolase) [Lentimonas sp.]|jgi:NTP pyrophosphatase (non-canonical NTP hydrolase)